MRLSAHSPLFIKCGPMCPHSRQSKPSIRTGRCTVPRAEARGYITRRARCVAFRADAWRCEGIGLVPTYRIPHIRTTQGTTRGLGGGRTIRKRHVTERRRRTIARERRAHRHVPSRRSLLGPLLLYETEGPVKTHANRPNACIFRPSWTSAPAEWDSRRAERAVFSEMVSSG